MAMQADRFQHLEYEESAFRTEALAVLGEYNKNSSSPPSRIDEVLRNTAYDKHTPWASSPTFRTCRISTSIRR